MLVKIVLMRHQHAVTQGMSKKSLKSFNINHSILVFVKHAPVQLIVCAFGLSDQ